MRIEIDRWFLDPGHTILRVITQVNLGDAKFLYGIYHNHSETELELICNSQHRIRKIRRDNIVACVPVTIPEICENLTLLQEFARNVQAEVKSIRC